MGVVAANIHWGRFVCPSCSQKKEKAAFELFLRSAWGLLSPSKQVLEVVLHVGKVAKFGAHKVNSGQDICSRVASVGNWKNFEKQAQCSKA